MIQMMRAVGSGAATSVGHRLALYTAGFSLLISLALGAVQVFSQYLEQRRALELTLDRIVLQLPPLAASLWSFDESQIQAGLGVVSQLPYVKQAILTMDGSANQWRAGTTSAHPVVRHYPLSVHRKGEDLRVGELVIEASLDTEIEELIGRSAKTLAIKALETALVAGFVFILLHRMVIRRLVKLRGRVVTLAPQFADTQLTEQSTGDELDQTEWALERTSASLALEAERRLRAEVELSRSEQRFRTLVNTAPDAILVFDLDAQQYIDANPAAESLFGCSRERFLNADFTPFWDTTQPDGRPAEAGRREMLERAACGETVRAERTLVRDNGERRHCDVIVLRIAPESRQLRVSIVDITERKNAELAIRNLNLRLQAMLDAAREFSIFAIDADGCIEVFNRGAERMLGYAAAEMVGHSPVTLFRASELARRAAELSASLGHQVSGLEATYAAARSGTSETRSWTLIRKDGQALRASLAISAIEDDAGATIGFLFIARDISEQLQAEAAQLRLTLHLDNLVRQRTQSLESANQALQRTLDELRQAKDQLVESEKLAALGSIVAAVAHELNTPIGNCRTVSSTLADRTQAFAATVSQGRLRKSDLDDYLHSTQLAMQLLERGLDRAASLVTRFKEIAVEQQSFQRSEFDLAHVISEVLGTFAGPLRDAGATMEVTCPASLVLDSYPDALKQVVSQLVDNALRHGLVGRTAGRIEISVETDSVAWLRLHVRDNGCGLDDEARRHIFEPFYTSQLGKGGSGLGMYISYNLTTRLLGGNIVANSCDTGAWVSLYLPMQAPAGEC